MYISVSMAIYVPFVSIYHNLKWIGSRVCDASCIEGSKTVYLLTQWCRVLLEKLTGLQLVKKFPIFHGTRRFMTALTSVHHLSILGQPIYSYPTSWRSVLILSTHLCLGLPSGLFSSSFPTKTLYTPLSSPTRTTCPAHLILLDFITRTILGEQCKSFRSSVAWHVNFLVLPELSTFKKLNPHATLYDYRTAITVSVYIKPLLYRGWKTVFFMWCDDTCETTVL